MLLRKRWDTLPPYLQTGNQVVGKHWVQCAFTMGPSYCSFGCTHCYLPKNANRVPMLSLDDMKQQIRVNRERIGEGGGIQITGGDVVEAYWRAGKKDDLTELIRYTVSLGLVPMLITHGQTLLDNPEYFIELVELGGLRKISCHIDITQAGRPGYSIRELNRESQLNPVRNRLVDLVMEVRRKTGYLVTAAQTVTVTSKNISSMGEILQWLIARPQNMEVTRTISFQTEAQVGRTLNQVNGISPEQVWSEIENTMGHSLPRDHLLFGHPDCSSTATIIARSSDGKVLPLCGEEPGIRQFWHQLLTTFSGIGARREGVFQRFLIKLWLILRRPSILIHGIQFIASLRRYNGLDVGMIRSLIRGDAKGFNIVMHNFMSEKQALNDSGCQTVKDRLNACSFRGAIEINGRWEEVPMCKVNALVRPLIYQEKVLDKNRATVIKFKS
ncbi:MAG: hypothetical protein GKR95_12325 [Gammaproteobacteria bacterium]|nr:hypothetical protein [Gammaproteobacteria bacterium]